jgi:multicomponent Na+:H+ antiporter subunit C
MDFVLERYNWWIVIILMMTGLYVVISHGNLVKKLAGLTLFQTSVFIYYISIGKIRGGTAPIILQQHDDVEDGAAHAALSDVLYSNPLPHVLILTAIVVGVATLAVGLALAVRIREAYGTVEEDEIEAADEVAEFGEAPPEAGAEA